MKKISNVHLVPRSILRNFKPVDVSKEEWEVKIERIMQSDILVDTKEYKRLDKIYQRFETYIPNLTKYLETTEDERFYLGHAINEGVKKLKISKEYKLWYGDLSFDEKFTGVTISESTGGISLISEARFASILELLMISLFVRTNNGLVVKEYDMDKINKERNEIDDLINNMTPVEIYVTKKGYELDDYKNILSATKTKRYVNGVGFKDFIYVQVRLSKKVTLCTYIYAYWLDTFIRGFGYHWKEIYNPKIIKTK